MILKDKDNTPEIYADLYAKYKISGTPFLAYRDLPGFLKIDSAKIPFEDNSFDLVFCSFVLLEIDTKEKIMKIVEEIKRVLKKGGIFISINCNDDTYNHNWLSLNTDFPENKNIDSGSRVKIEFKNIDLTIYDYFWKKSDYIEMFTKVGLGILKIHNPFGTDEDGYAWIDEKEVSPSSIFICQKE